MMMSYGPLDEPATGSSEFGGDGKIGWADDLGQAKGRKLSGGEEAALLRKLGDEELRRQFAPHSDEA